MAKKVKVKMAKSLGPASNPQLTTMDGSQGLGNVKSTISANIGSLSQDRDQAEMAQAKNLMRQRVKAKAPVKAPEVIDNPEITEPLSSQSWANAGNDPLKYHDYVNAFNEQQQQKNGKRKKSAGSTGKY